MELPDAGSTALADVPLPRQEGVWVTLLRSGRCRVEFHDGDAQGAIRFLTYFADRKEKGLSILLRADRRAPWSVARPVIEFVWPGDPVTSDTAGFLVIRA